MSVVSTLTSSSSPLAASASKSASIKNNGETSLTNTIIATGCLIDTIGGVRQVGFATSASAQLASSVGVSAIASSAASVGLLCTGPLSMAFSSLCTIPDARSYVIKAQKELDEATSAAQRKSMEVHEESSENDSLLHAQTKRKAVESDPRVKSARQVLTIKKIGVASQVFLFAMGAMQTASGIVDMLGSSVASVFHYSPVLTGAAAATATVVTTIGLGVIYLIRGGTMIARAFKAHSIIRNFDKEFKAQSTIDAKIEFLKAQEIHGSTYMSARLDSSCLETTKEGQKCVMTAHGFKFEDGRVVEYNESEKVDYLQAVEKGIFTEKLKHVLCGLIGVSMIIGGVLTLALTVISHGMAPIAISMASAIFFMASEYIFLTYDAPGIFDKMRDWLFVSSIPRPNASVEVVNANDDSLEAEDVEGAVEEEYDDTCSVIAVNGDIR